MAHHQVKTPFPVKSAISQVSFLVRMVPEHDQVKTENQPQTPYQFLDQAKTVVEHLLANQTVNYQAKMEVDYHQNHNPFPDKTVVDYHLVDQTVNYQAKTVVDYHLNHNPFPDKMAQE
jgi:hypothetical protein